MGAPSEQYRAPAQKMTSGWKVRRTEIIRALVAALMTAHPDLTASRSARDRLTHVEGAVWPIAQ